MLEDEGYLVVAETGRGDEAIELVEEHSPDLCIFDIKMPGMDGLAAAREVSSQRKAAVVILTAFSQRSLIEEARDAGVLSYLVKPFQREELVSAIEVALGRFEDIMQLDATVRELEEKLEARKAVDRAKGILMDEHGLAEADAFTFVQRTAMSERSSMLEVANRIISGDLLP
mgnify:FL=1